jgi:hypothetical protein
MKQPSQVRAATRKHVILFLAANPPGTPRLSLDEEAHSIHVELKRSGHRDRFDFVTRWAAEPLDLLRELRELKPTVVHFSGHGGGSLAAAATRETCIGRDVVVPATQRSVQDGLYFHSAADGVRVVSPDAISGLVWSAAFSPRRPPRRHHERGQDRAGVGRGHGQARH